MWARRRHAVVLVACALSAAFALGCGSSAATHTARSADNSAPPSPVAGATTASYPPADPVTVVACAKPSGASYCTDPKGLRVSAVGAGEPCHVAIDPPGVSSGSWQPLGVGNTHLACGAGRPGSACVVGSANGMPPVNGAWDRLGACVTARREGGPCGVDAHTRGVWHRVGGTAATPRHRCEVKTG